MTPSEQGVMMTKGGDTRAPMQKMKAPGSPRLPTLNSSAPRQPLAPSRPDATPWHPPPRAPAHSQPPRIDAHRQEVKYFGMPRRFFVIYLPLLTHAMCTEMTGVVGVLALYYMNAQGWANGHNILMFAIAVALQSALPALTGSLLRRLSLRFGPRTTILGCQYVSLVALVVVFLVKQKAVFIVGVALTALQGPALQPVRLLYSNHFVPFPLRTRFLSVVALVSVFGTLISCGLMFIYAEVMGTPRQHVLVYSWTSTVQLTLDSSTITYLVAACSTVVNIFLGEIFLQDIVVGMGEGENAPLVPRPMASHGSVFRGDMDPENPGTIKLLRQATDGLKEIVLYFSGVIGLSNMTYGIVSIIVFPILINHAKFSQTEVAMFGLLIVGLAVIPPALMTIFPNVRDRTCMVLALLLQCAGLFVLSFANGKRWWAAILGAILTAHGTTYLTTASMSIYLLLISTQKFESVLLQVPNLFQAAGLGLGQVLGGCAIYYWYDSGWMLFGALPSLVALAVTVLPWVFERLDPPYGTPWLEPIFSPASSAFTSPAVSAQNSPRGHRSSYGGFSQITVETQPSSSYLM